MQLHSIAASTEFSDGLGVTLVRQTDFRVFCAPWLKLLLFCWHPKAHSLHLFDSQVLQDFEMLGRFSCLQVLYHCGIECMDDTIDSACQICVIFATIAVVLLLNSCCCLIPSPALYHFGIHSVNGADNVSVIVCVMWDVNKGCVSLDTAQLAS